MLEMARSVVRLGDDYIDWDMQRDNYILAVLDGDGNGGEGKSSDRRRSRRGGTGDGPSEQDADDDDQYFGLIDDMLDYDLDGYLASGGDEYVSHQHGSAEAALAEGVARPGGGVIETHRRHLQTGNPINNIDGDVFGGYEYSRGACPGAGSLGVPCAPDDLPSLCDKYDRESGSFRACLNACKPAFCCIHDAPRDLNPRAPNCNTDENCGQYNYCYIAWWKLHDTVGPALYLRVEQDDAFYDIDADEIEEDVTNDPFYNQVLLHHFDNLTAVIEDGTVPVEGGGTEFNADRIFLDEDYWLYPVADRVDISDDPDNN